MAAKQEYRLEKDGRVQITDSVDRKVKLEFDGYKLVEPKAKKAAAPAVVASSNK